MRLPSASAIQRAFACEASVLLPVVPETEQSAAALRGSRIHAYAAARLRRWPIPDIGKTKVDHIQLGRLRRYLGHGERLCETAYSYDGARAEYLGENCGRDYARPGTLCGSADIVMRRPKRLLVDIKSGSRSAPDVAGNWQLAALAVFEWLAFPCDSVTAAIAKLERDGSWQFTEHTWSRANLANIRARLDAKIRQWREADEIYRAGFGATKTDGPDCYFCRCECEHSRVGQLREAA